MASSILGQIPTTLLGPSEKERKYDRQLRLWAASGQVALESAHVMLINTGPGTVGIEILKNLVLPGIGKFTIVDDSAVTEADLGVNFFLDQGAIGRPSGECCAELLMELNPEVHGDWYPKSKARLAMVTTGPKKMCLTPSPQDPVNLQEILTLSPDISVILYTLPIKQLDLASVEAYSKRLKIPVISVHSTGFYSYFQFNLPGVFPVVDTHPDETATTDLRLLAPWEELSEFAKTITKNIDTLDDHEHGHLPFVAILLHYLDRWKESHHGADPATYSEKIAFRRLVSDAMRLNTPEGGEENFEEAVNAVLKTTNRASLPDSLKQVFEYQSLDPTERRSSFWVVAAGIKVFYERHGCLPLPGNIPDMKAQSEVYVKLQDIYKRKARGDAAEVLEIVRSLPGGREVKPEEVELFCKNASFVKLINGAVGGQETLREVAEREFANDELTSFTLTPRSLIPIYLALFACSEGVATAPSDIVGVINRLVPGAGARDGVWQAAQEVCRAGGGELHNTSAVTGGMVAQEMVKIITKQYIPIDNTCIYDGIGARCQVLRL